MAKVKRRLRPWFKTVLVLLVILAITFGGLQCYKLLRPKDSSIDQNTIRQKSAAQIIEVPAFVQQQYLSQPSSRNQLALGQVRGIVIHYVGNPGTTAAQNRSYFNKPDTTVNSHFIVGLEGEVVQCIPLTEQSCASNNRNADTISIETCHPDESGKFNEATYNSLVRLTAWLCNAYGLDSDSVIRHYDITGKECPKYFVEHPESWKQFRQDVHKGMEENIWKT